MGQHTAGFAADVRDESAAATAAAAAAGVG